MSYRIEDLKNQAIALYNAGQVRDAERLKAMYRVAVAMKGAGGIIREDELDQLLTQTNVALYGASGQDVRQVDATPGLGTSAGERTAIYGGKFGSDVGIPALRDVPAMPTGLLGEVAQHVPMAFGGPSPSMVQEGVRRAAQYAGGLSPTLSQEDIDSIAQGGNVPGAMLTSPLWPDFMRGQGEHAPSQQEVSTARKLTTLDKRRKELESQTYSSLSQTFDEMPTEMAAQGAASMILPMPAPVARTVGQGIDRLLADRMAREAGVRSGVVMSGPQAGMNAAYAAGLSDQDAPGATAEGLAAGALTYATGVPVEVVRGMRYRAGTTAPLSQAEQDILNPPPPDTTVERTSITPEERAAIGEDMGVAPLEQQALSGEMFPQQAADLVRELTPAEVAALPKDARERYAVLARYMQGMVTPDGKPIRPTMAEVNRDFTAMNQMAQIANSTLDTPEARLIRARYAALKQVPRDVIAGGGNWPGLMAQGVTGADVGPLAGRVMTEARAAEVAARQEAYKQANEKAAAAGIKAPIDTLLEPYRRNRSTYRLGQANLAAAQYGNMADTLAMKLRSDTLKKLEQEIIDSGISKDSPDFEVLRFKKIADRLGGIDPVQLEMFAQDIGKVSRSLSPRDPQFKPLEDMLASIKELRKSSAFPEDFYEAPRQLSAQEHEVLRNVPMLKDFADLKGDKYAEDKMFTALWKMPAKQWDITNAWITKHGNDQTRRAWDATKKAMANKIYQDILTASTSQAEGVAGREMMSATFGLQLDSLIGGSKKGGQGRLVEILGPGGLEELAMLRRYLAALEAPATQKSAINPSGSGIIALEGVRSIADRMQGSTNATQRALGTFLDKFIAKWEQPFRETDASMAARLSREQLGTPAAASAVAQRAALERRASLAEDAKRKGFNSVDDYIAYLARRVPVAAPGVYSGGSNE